MNFIKGKGAQLNVPNKFSSTTLSTEDWDGIDEEHDLSSSKIQVFRESPRSIISTNTSPDLSFEMSVNPYQGCEHGCVYCYARNTHEYWGFSAGLDFESKIKMKPNAAKLLEEAFLKPSYKPSVIMLSGNTDCYQPIERKYALTRQLLGVCNSYQNPVSIITKNALILRDIDVLSELASKNLVHVLISMTTLNEDLRRTLEPRTASAKKKLQVIEQLTDNNIPVGVMHAPIIPSLNQSETPALLKAASEAGASFASYSVIRLNGQVGKIFKDWLEKVFPDRAEKVWNQIMELHDGKVNESGYGKRMKGEGTTAKMIKQMFEVAKGRYFPLEHTRPLSTEHFRKGGCYSLF